MTTSVQIIVEAAYNRSAANDPGKLAQDPELILHLNRVYQRTWALVARSRPDEFASTTSLLLAGVPGQAALPADLIAILGVLNAAGGPVWIIPATERFRSWHVAPAMYRIGVSLISRNKAGDPLAGDTLTATMLDAPPPLTVLASLLDVRFPIRHVQLLVDYLACYLSTKDTGRSAEDHGKLVAELRADGAAFAAEFELAPADIQWIHADVERQAKVPA